MFANFLGIVIVCEYWSMSINHDLLTPIGPVLIELVKAKAGCDLIEIWFIAESH